MPLDCARYRVPTDGAFKLKSIRPDDDQGISEKKARRRYKNNIESMGEWQEKLYAESRRSLLIVLQAMDTAGKDSSIRKTVGGLNPQGCRVAGFRAPSTEERSHDFLWRVHQRVPPAGMITVFNRSHYEDVLIVRVHEWADAATIEKRYGHINDFERLLADNGVRILKIMLHISKDYQLERLRRRLRRPDKHWKFNPDDLKERALWGKYMHSYEIALNRCSTDHAPWHVIPAQKRWFRNAVVSQLIVDALADINPRYPVPEYDPADYPPESIS